MQKITDNEIKNILGNKQLLIRGIQDKLYLLCNEKEDETDALFSLVYPKGISLYSTKNKSEKNDLTDLYEKYKKLQIVLNREKREIIADLIEEEWRINKIWNKYMKLSYPHHDILRDLYVKKEKYKSVMKELGFSYGTFERKRREALDSVAEL